MKTIAIMGLKGGVGKTTAAINIAATLAAGGQRVLLVELSKQGNIGKFFSAQNKSAMIGVLNDQPIQQAIERTEYSGLDIIASDLGLLNAKPSGRTLKNQLDIVSGNYDYCVIDCEPTFDTVTITAVMAADRIYTPIKLDQYSVDAAIELIDQISQVDEDKIGGVFVSVISSSKADQVALERVKQQLNLMPVMIHKSPKIDRMSWQRQPINVLSPRSKAAREYADLTDEIIADFWELSESDN